MSKNNKKKIKKNISRKSKKQNKNTYSGNEDYNPQTLKDLPLGTRIVVIICILILTVFPFIIILVAFSVLIIEGVIVPLTQDDPKRNRPPAKEESYSIYSEYIYLDETEEGWYETVSADASYDKKLKWDDRTNSYYDNDSKCYIWYDKGTNEWQYWFKSVSSDYGDYGWRKCSHNSWEIENSSGEWVPLPESYNRNDLWYIK